MWYAIISEDVDNSWPLRVEHRAAHLERLTELNNAFGISQYFQYFGVPIPALVRKIWLIFDIEE